MNLTKKKKIIILCVCIVLLLMGTMLPSMYRQALLWKAYATYPDRTRASDYTTKGGRLMAEAIILQDVDRMKYVDENYYHAYGIDTNSKVKSAKKSTLAMEWGCHTCFDYMLDTLGTPTIADLNQTIYQQDNYYFDQVIERVRDVNTDVMTPPLRAAIGSNKYDMVVKLVEKGADINQRYAEQSMLELAYEEKDEKIIEYLLSKGAR